MNARAGWEAKLELNFGLEASRTTLATRRHSGPLVVQRPFYPEGDVCHLYVIHPPGGLVGGDRLTLNVTAPAGAHGLITTPAAGKFYRSLGLPARLEQTLSADDGWLEWLPQENIFYPQSLATLQTRVMLRGEARFIGWELSCFGFPARDLTLDIGIVHQDFELWHDGRPLLMERLRLQADSGAFHQRWGLAGHHTAGTMMAFPCRQEHLIAAREVIEPNTFVVCSLVEGVLICRALHKHAESIKRAFLEVWRGLRPQLLGRPAVMPRIWAT